MGSFLKPTKNNMRANDIGCAIYAEDAAQYNTAANNNIVVTHPACVALENTTTATLTVGAVMPDSSSNFDIAITTIGANSHKSLQCEREFNLTSVSPTYSTRTLSWTGVANTYYIIKVYSVDTPAATSTLTVTSGKGVFVSKNSADTATVKTVTNKGVTSFIFKVAAATTDPSIVLGAGFSASTDGTTPTFTIHKITAWTLGQLNILY